LGYTVWLENFEVPHRPESGRSLDGPSTHSEKKGWKRTALRVCGTSESGGEGQGGDGHQRASIGDLNEPTRAGGGGGFPNETTIKSSEKYGNVVSMVAKSRLGNTRLISPR